MPAAMAAAWRAEEGLLAGSRRQVIEGDERVMRADDETMRPGEGQCQARGQAERETRETEVWSGRTLAYWVQRTN